MEEQGRARVTFDVAFCRVLTRSPWFIVDFKVSWLNWNPLEVMGNAEKLGKTWALNERLVEKRRKNSSTLDKTWKKNPVTGYN